MKINFYRVSCAVVILALMGLTFGCNKISSNKVPDSSIFDFTTKTESVLQVQYDVPEGYSVYFEVYSENPEYLDADGQIVKKDIEPIDAGYTDTRGGYMHKLSVLSTVDRVYIYSPYAGVPRLMEAKINKGGVSRATLKESLYSKSSHALSSYKDAPYNTVNGGDLRRMGYWINDSKGYALGGIDYTIYGRPDYLTTDKITISADILQLINQTIPEGGGVDAALIKNGDIHVTETANVELFLIDEGTSANSTLAYYCYETANPPKTQSDIKDIIIAFPNSKVFKYHDYNPAGYNGAMERGEGIKLHYWKDGQDKGDEFPAGVSVGWVIYNQSYAPCMNNGNLNAGATHIFGDKTLNEDNRSHVALFRNGDKVIFGFEDWYGDYDYNDVVFYVKSNPIGAITPEIPEVKPDVPSDDKVATWVTYRGILAFEDLWPSRGDFDMNDVVIRYESKVGYNNKNEVLQTSDKYTVLHSGASVNNSFAYQLDVRRSEVEISINSSLGGDGGAYVDPNLDRATIRLANDLLPYANVPNNKAVFEVVAKYTGRRIQKDDFTKPPYNAFITTRSQDVEVHLTNNRPTERLDKGLLGSLNDRSEPNRNIYYVTYDENGIQMPFAIDIAFDKVSEMNKFIITDETMRIDQHYPSFINWVKTNGREDKDWYLKPKKK